MASSKSHHAIGASFCLGLERDHPHRGAPRSSLESLVRKLATTKMCSLARHRGNPVSISLSYVYSANIISLIHSSDPDHSPLPHVMVGGIHQTALSACMAIMRGRRLPPFRIPRALCIAVPFLTSFACTQSVSFHMTSEEVGYMQRDDGSKEGILTI